MHHLSAGCAYAAGSIDVLPALAVVAPGAGSGGWQEPGAVDGVVIRAAAAPQVSRAGPRDGVHCAITSTSR